MLRIISQRLHPVTQLRRMNAKSSAARAYDTPRSLTSFTASSLNSRVNFRLSMTHLLLHKTPNLVSSEPGAAQTVITAPKHSTGSCRQNRCGSAKFASKRNGARVSCASERETSTHGFARLCHTVSDFRLRVLRILRKAATGRGVRGVLRRLAFARFGLLGL